MKAEGTENKDEKKLLMLEAERMLGQGGRENFSMVFVVCKVLFRSVMLFDLFKIVPHNLWIASPLSSDSRIDSMRMGLVLSAGENSFGLRGILECGDGGNCPEVKGLQRHH